MPTGSGTPMAVRLVSPVDGPLSSSDPPAGGARFVSVTVTELPVATNALAVDAGALTAGQRRRSPLYNTPLHNTAVRPGFGRGFG